MLPKIKKSKKKAFTLLELMVCLAIIGMLGAILGMKGMDLLAHHKFHSALQTLLFDVHRHQILAMNQNADITCSFKKTGAFYTAYLQSECPEFIPTTYELKEVGCLSFQEKSVSEFSLTFFSSGRISPSGILKIGPKRESQDPLFLDLSYPIVFQSKLPVKKNSFFSPPLCPEKGF